MRGRIRFFAMSYAGSQRALVELPDATCVIAVPEKGAGVAMWRSENTSQEGVDVRSDGSSEIMLLPRASNVVEVVANKHGAYIDYDQYVVDRIEQPDMVWLRWLADEALAATGRKRTEMLERLRRELGDL